MQALPLSPLFRVLYTTYLRMMYYKILVHRGLSLFGDRGKQRTLLPEEQYDAFRSFDPRLLEQ